MDRRASANDTLVKNADVFWTRSNVDLTGESSGQVALTICNGNGAGISWYGGRDMTFDFVGFGGACGGGCRCFRTTRPKPDAAAHGKRIDVRYFCSYGNVTTAVLIRVSGREENGTPAARPGSSTSLRREAHHREAGSQSRIRRQRTRHFLFLVVVSVAALTTRDS